MLWETKSGGLFRVVRLTHHFAFKTPHILNREQVKNDWRVLGTPGRKTIYRVALEDVEEALSRELLGKRAGSSKVVRMAPQWQTDDQRRWFVPHSVFPTARIVGRDEPSRQGASRAG
jgi:hypothetical protein